jgi:hypothetical protein
MGERKVQQTRGFFRVVEKQLVKIAEPKEQQGIRRDAGAQPLVLLHHRGERVGHGFRMESAPGDCEPELPQATASPSFANYYSRQLAHRSTTSQSAPARGSASLNFLTQIPL